MIPSKLQNLIDGRWTDAYTGNTLTKEDPTTGETIATLPDSTEEDAYMALDVATKFKSKLWLSLSQETLDKAFTNIQGELQERRTELVETLMRETGKNCKEADAEITKTVQTFETIQNMKYAPLGEVLPSKDGVHMFTIRHPVGIVVSITPWNFPLYICAQHIAPAIMAKNAVILKCSPKAPISSTKLVEIISACGLPKEMISLIHGQGEKLPNLITDPRVDMVSLTGSNKTAKEIGKKRRGRRYMFEGGGNNFTIILKDADIKKAAEKTVEGLSQYSGQKCVTTGGALVEEEILQEFLKQAKESMAKLRVGDTRRGADIGPLIDKEKIEELEKKIQKAIKDGAQIIYGGRRANLEGQKGSFYQPTIIIVKKDQLILYEELFAPILKVVAIKTFNEAVGIINSQDYALASSIFTNDSKKVWNFIQEIHAGMININSHTGGSEPHTPFGGWKNSGNGFRLGNPQEALKAFSETKTIKWKM
ncbi:MAG: aldehyde dehydrogenase family protein [Candidatus Altiarchaeota archaeon]